MRILTNLSSRLFMGIKFSKSLCASAFIASTLFFTGTIAFASDEDDMAEMQKNLNAEVMEKPFLAEQPEKVEAYIEEAMKKQLKPPEYTGRYWRRGYTCHDLLRYSWREYRDCRYYHRYYGRYYPYR